MKTMKIAIIAAIITAIIIVSCSFAMADSYYGEFYPRLTIVIDIVELDGLRYIACQDKEGNIWGFYDDNGEWEEGDIANLLMWNMGECEEDDEIIEIYWEGYAESIETFFNLEGWR